jgi:hypothetical protein
MNDIVDNIETDINIFADDTSLIECMFDPVISTQKINRDLETLSTWASQWLMVFNIDKTVLMTFSYKKHRNLPQVKFRGVQLPDSATHTHLGLTLSSNMSWDAHVDRVCMKAGRFNNILRRLKFVLPRSSLDTLYKVKIRPVIEYANVVYDNCSVRLSNKLERLQLQSARICTGALRNSNSTKLLQEVGWDPLTIRRKWHKLCLFYKMSNSLVPPYLASRCPPRVSTLSRYPLRNSRSLQLVKCRTSSYKNSFIPSTTSNWNGLDPDIRSSPSLRVFKSKLFEQSKYPKPASYYSIGNRRENIDFTLACVLVLAH